MGIIAVPTLTELLRDRDSRVREAAARALGLMGPKAKAAIPGLKELLQDQDEAVSQAAAAALQRIESKSE